MQYSASTGNTTWNCVPLPVLPFPDPVQVPVPAPFGWDKTTISCEASQPSFFKGRSRKALEDLAVEIKERGGEAVVTVCDHGDIEATEALFHKIEQMV